MLSAFKRKKTEKSKAVIHGKDLLRLVLPYVFPGHYERNYLHAFKTFLALSGTCRKLRYWNSLRRWIGWLSPLCMRGMLRAHSFPVPMTADEYLPVQDRIHRYLEMHREIPDAARIDFVSRTVANAQADSSEGTQSNFEADFAGIPFFDVIDCYVRSPNKAEERKIIAFRPSTFAELVLFCYATLTRPFVDAAAVLIVCGWKTVDDGILYVKERDRQNIVVKSILVRLSKMGVTAPDEVGFHCGSLPVTAYAFFEKMTTEGNRKNKFSERRLEEFAHRWYPSELFHDGAKFKAAYTFDIIFEEPPRVEQATQENEIEVHLDRSKSMEVIKPKKRHKSK
jgi:hypothetical protein